MRISDWSSDVCSSDLVAQADFRARLDVAIRALKRLEGGEMPTPEELSAAPQLDYWCFTDSLPWSELTGIVTGHPILPDGDQIVTSPLLWLSKDRTWRSEEHTSELQSLMRISCAVFC